MRAFAALAVLFAVACGPVSGKPAGNTDSGVTMMASGAQVPDFHLVDLNPASARAGQTVSPRDYAGVVTGWYFLHTT